MELYEGGYGGADLTPMKPVEVSLTTSGQNFLCEGIQLRERKLVPKQLGRFILWLFFHRIDSATKVTLSGFVNALVDVPAKRAARAAANKRFATALVIALGLFLAGCVLLRFASR